ncbi:MULTISPECIES: transcriptional regulator [Pseudomonas]|uniref:Transcriptional regulator n=1 Tax=Pseudomonas lundensis TaxID=86185 RepID=A0A266NE52_9PSED|nr:MULTISPECIES: transcriptional regulator [Pseudomonas]NMY36880.1 transcriptional regulator [Pseudomonas sp. WS 5078]NMY59804.1 transcriptional regulator [Pseudomonas sp. WS 5354]NMY73113.1 transcriptional regulator [Pseudomonas sp. WS 5071]OZY60749.1 transcriptional regulator [Pseudomonas lundensis]
MNIYNWPLIECLLHKAQNGAGEPFTPRVYAEELAVTMSNRGDPVGNLDEFKVLATDYEAMLLKQGYIEPRRESEGGTGENYELTERGSRLLSLIDSSIPGDSHPLEVLDAQQDPLDPQTFDALTAQPQIA